MQNSQKSELERFIQKIEMNSFLPLYANDYYVMFDPDTADKITTESKKNLNNLNTNHMENKKMQELSKDDLNEIITSNKWIKIRKFDAVKGRDDDEETEFLINKCQELASLLLYNRNKKEHYLLQKDEQSIIDDILVDHDINVNNGIVLDIVLSCDLAMREYAKLKNTELQSKYDELYKILEKASDTRFANYLYKKGLIKLERNVDIQSEYINYLGSLDPRTKA